MAGQETFTLYKKANIEGYLDKISSGRTSKWLSGKTRMWCELYGTVLYISKDNKRTSSSQSVDMSQVHMVRKVTTDKSGLQFEIQGKLKAHTFCASSAAECDNWIRQLQAAMTLKDQETASAQNSTVSVGDYETITVLPEDKPAKPCISIGASSAVDPGYSEVEFVNPPAAAQTSTAASVDVEGNDGYSTVEFRRSRGSDRPVIKPDQESRAVDQTSSPQPSAGTPGIEVDSYGYAKVELRKKSLTGPPSQPTDSVTSKEEEGKEGESYGYARVSKVRKASEGDSSEGTVSGPADEASQPALDEDELIDTVQKNPDPVPPFPHPLQSADHEPLAALQEFLSNNQKLCRPSFSLKTETEDAVGDMKKLLEELRV